MALLMRQPSRNRTNAAAKADAPVHSGVDEIEIPAFLRKPAGCCRLAGAGVLGWPPDGKARARP
jgi:hypothetical protein